MAAGEEPEKAGGKESAGPAQDQRAPSRTQSPTIDERMRTFTVSLHAE
jgi:hypothetical protein